MVKIMRACAAMLMSFLLIISMCCPASAQTNDYVGHWAGETLAKWVDMGFLKADAKGNLQPDEAVSRGKFMSIVNKSMGYTKPSVKIKDFTDITESSPYYNDIAIALGAGYISGTSANTMNPAGFITREQIMTIFCRMIGLDVDTADSRILNAVKDSGKVSGWAKKYTAAAIENGYLSGANGNINPLQNITLAEAVVLLDRVYTDTRVYSFPWTYGPVKQPVKVNNVIILGNSVNLQNIIVSNNLSINGNTAISKISLSNVTVNGVMNVEGSRLETLSLQGGSINELNLQGENISMTASSSVVIPKLIINGKNAKINLAKDSVIKLAEVKADAKFTGDGTIQKAIVSAKGVDFSKRPNGVSTSGSGNYTISSTNLSTTAAKKDRDDKEERDDRKERDDSTSNKNKTQTVSVTDVSLNNNTLNLTAGGATATLVATVNPNNTTDKTMTWISSAPSVATVANGVVTPILAGDAIIAVVTQDGSKTASCAVTVTAPTVSVVSVTGVTLNNNTLNLTAGGATATLTATVNPNNATNKNVTWSSSAPDVATVVNGVVTSVSAGKTTITVTTEDGNKTSSCDVTVEASTIPVTGVNMSVGALALKAGGNAATLVASVIPTNAINKNVTWSSSAPDVATIVNGVVTPVSAGKATITVTTQDGNKTASCDVTVTAADVAATGVTLNINYVQAAAGGTNIILIATVTPVDATNKDVTWSSSNTSVATVDASGIIKPLAKGKTTITAKTHNDLTATCEIEVKEAANGLSFTKDLTIAEGAKIKIAPEVVPNDAYLELTWVSGNTSIAAVDMKTGEVTGVSSGTTTITVTNHNSITASYNVTVKQSLTNVILDSPVTVPFKGSVPLTLTLTPAGAFGEYVLESANPSIAYVDKNNNIVAVSAGTTTISAKINGVVKSTCDVTVSAPVATGTTPGLEYVNSAYIDEDNSDLTLGIVPSNDPRVTHYVVTYHTGYSDDPAQLFGDLYGSQGILTKDRTSVVMEVPTGLAVVSIFAFQDSNLDGKIDAGEQIGDVFVLRAAALPRIRNVSAGGVPFSMYLGGFPGMLYFLDPISGGFYFDDMDGADGYFMNIVKDGETWGTYQWMKDSPTDKVGLVSVGFVDFHPNTPASGLKVPMERLDFQSGNYSFYIVPYVCDPAYERQHADTSKLLMGNMFITNLQLSSIGTNNWTFDNE